MYLLLFQTQALCGAMSPLPGLTAPKSAPPAPPPGFPVMNTPLLGSTHSVPPHSGHDVGGRPPWGSVQALVSPRTQHSSPLCVAEGHLILGAPLGAGGACPAWAGVREGEQGHAAHPAPVSPSLRPLPETVIEIGCGRRARAACRAPRWAAQPCHTSCRHHSLPSPPAPARATLSAAPSTPSLPASPTSCPSTAFPRG